MYARQVLQHNNFRPAPSGLIDLTTNDPDETVEPVEGRRHFSYDPYSPRYGPSTYVGLTPQKLRPSKEPENLDFNEIPTEKSTEKPRNIHDSIGDESIISNYSEHDNLSTQSASVASDALPQEHDDSDDESDGSSWKEYDYGGSDEEEEVEKEEELAQYNDSAANFHQPSSLLSTDARHGRFPDAHEVTSQEFNETPRDGNKVSGSQMLPVVLSPLAFLDQVDDPATIDTGDDVPQAASTTFNVSMHQIQDQGQQPPPHHTVEKQNTEYLHAREENRRVLGLPSRTGSGEVDEQPIGQEKASDEADAQDDETLSWNDQPSLAFASNLSNDLVKSGAKFLRTPFTNDFILTPAVQAPSPVLDETSAYQFEMSKLAAEVGVNSENPPDKSIKAIVDDNDTSQDKTTPTKRKAEDISQSSQKEEEAVQPKAVEAPTTTCQLVQNPEQEVAELAPVSTLPCQPTASVSLDLPRPAKRLRRAAEVVGYAAIGGIAVMSALIATAPAL